MVPMSSFLGRGGVGGRGGGEGGYRVEKIGAGSAGRGGREIDCYRPVCSFSSRRPSSLCREEPRGLTSSVESPRRGGAQITDQIGGRRKKNHGEGEGEEERRSPLDSILARRWSDAYHHVGTVCLFCVLLHGADSLAVFQPDFSLFCCFLLKGTRFLKRGDLVIVTMRRGRHLRS